MAGELLLEGLATLRHRHAVHPVRGAHEKVREAREDRIGRWGAEHPPNLGVPAHRANLERLARHWRLGETSRYIRLYYGAIAQISALGRR